MQDNREAVNKRHPLISRSEDGKVSRVFCSEHPGRFATFHCCGCGKAFCEKCLGEEERADVYCLRCRPAPEPVCEQGNEPAVASHAFQGAHVLLAVSISLIVLLVVYVVQQGGFDDSGGAGTSSAMIVAASPEFKKAEQEFMQMMNEADQMSEPPAPPRAGL